MQPAYGAEQVAQFGPISAGVHPINGEHQQHDTQMYSVIVKDFPSDVKERELMNFGRFLPGFRKCEPVFPDAGNEEEGICAKLSFAGLYNAEHAANSLNGCRFDSESKLRAVTLDNSGNQVTPRGQGQPQEQYYAYAPTLVMPQSVATNGAAPMTAIPLSPMIPSQQDAVNAHIVALNNNAVMTQQQQQQSQNPPCNTLFIGNLTDGVDEQELRDVFGSQPGFQQLKLAQTKKGISAFIEFDNIESAIECHKSKQGIVLKSSERGPIRVQFSKNPFGYRDPRSLKQTLSPMAQYLPAAYFGITHPHPASAYVGYDYTNTNK